MGSVRIRRGLAGFGLALLIAVAGPGIGRAATDPCGAHPWCNRALSPDQRTALVVAAMTTQEKVAFLGGDNLGGVGSSDTNHTGVQDGVPRLGVPTVNYTDGPQGPRQGSSAGLPEPLALAATFSPAMARLYATVIGDESRAKGNEVVFGPTINIMRTPLGGRTYEAFGEDPFLTTSMTVPWIEALQRTGVMADVKHFAENNQEGVDPTGRLNQPGAPLGVGLLGSRYFENAIVDDRTLHEIELRAFQAAVQVAHAATVMCAYVMVNATYSCENGTLLQKILRGEWGFNGYVLADYLAAHNTIASLRNGLDFEPWPPAAYQPLEIDAALAAGVPVSTLDAHVKDILTTWFRYGLLDRAPYPDDDNLIKWARDEARARRIEARAVTVLRNRRHLLPLRARRLHRVAVVGKTATTFVTGGGSGSITPHRFTSILAGIKAEVGPGVTVTYDDGSSLSAAVADAKAADVVIAAASDYYTEGADRSCLTLECPNNNGDQDGLISAIAAANPRTVVVLESGGPDLTPWRSHVGALLEAWYAGGPGGSAIADVLFGRADPGGRLPVTFPAAADQIPLSGDTTEYPGVANQVHYDEGVLVGYRWYDAHHEKPAYPFGFGLSYTSFRYSHLRIGRTSARSGRVVVRITVRNVGRRRGWAVPELYLHLALPGGLASPPDQLAGSATVLVRPHRSRMVRIVLNNRSFSYWNAATQAWTVAPGCDTVMVGRSSRSLPLRRTIAVGGARCAG